MHKTRGPEWIVDLILRTFETVKHVYPLETFVSGWFIGHPPLEDIYHDNFKELMVWAIYSKEMQEATTQESHLVDRAVSTNDRSHVDLS